MTITARDSLSAHIFLLDSDKNVLIESAENDATISDRSWIEKISGNTGDFLFTADGQGYDCVYQRSSDTGTYSCRNDSYEFLTENSQRITENDNHAYFGKFDVVYFSC